MRWPGSGHLNFCATSYVLVSPACKFLRGSLRVLPVVLSPCPLSPVLPPLFPLSLSAWVFCPPYQRSSRLPRVFFLCSRSDQFLSGALRLRCPFEVVPSRLVSSTAAYFHAFFLLASAESGCFFGFSPHPRTSFVPFSPPFAITRCLLLSRFCLFSPPSILPLTSALSAAGCGCFLFAFCFLSLRLSVPGAGALSHPLFFCPFFLTTHASPLSPALVLLV